MVVEEKVAVFIDNVMIATETEERHDEIVEEVLRRKQFICEVREVCMKG